MQDKETRPNIQMMQQIKKCFQKESQKVVSKSSPELVLKDILNQ